MNVKEDNLSDPFSAKRILSALERKGVLSLQQARDIYAGRFKLMQQFERRRSREDTAGNNEKRDKPAVFDPCSAYH